MDLDISKPSTQWQTTAFREQSGQVMVVKQRRFQRGRKGRRHEQGATLIVTVLILMVVLGGLLIISTNVSLTSTRSTAEQRQILPAQYAADSGAYYTQSSFKVAKQVIESPSVPKDSNGRPTSTYGDLKDKLGRLCRTAISRSDIAWKAVENATNTPTPGSNPPTMGTKICDIDEITSKEQLAFFDFYYPYEESKFGQHSIQQEEASDFIYRIFTTNKVDIKYDENTKLTFSSLINPFALTTIGDNTFRIYYTIPDLVATGSYASATRVKGKKSDSSVSFIELKLRLEGAVSDSSKYAYLMGGRGRNSGDGRENTQNTLTCQDYFEGPVHSNTFFRLNQQGCRTSVDGIETHLGATFNGKITSTNCLDSSLTYTIAKTSCDFVQPSGWGYIYNNTPFQENRTSRATNVAGTQSDPTNPLGYTFLATPSVSPSSITPDGVSSSWATHLPSHSNYKVYHAYRPSYTAGRMGPIVGVDPLHGLESSPATLPATSALPAAPIPNFRAPYVKMPTPPTGHVSAARTKGFYVKGAANRVQLSVEGSGDNAYQVVELNTATGVHTLRYNKTGSMQIKISGGTYVPAVLQNITDASPVGTINWRAAPAGATPNKVDDAIIYVDGEIISLTGVERSTSTVTDSQTPSIASFANITIVSPTKITITGDLLYEKKPCTLQYRPSAESCERVNGVYKYRNLLGVYSIGSNIEIAHGTARAQVTTKTSTNTLSAPENVVIDGFLLAPTGQVTYDARLATARDSSTYNIKGRATFRGGVTTGFVGSFANYNRVHQSYVFDVRGLEMSPAGFPGMGAINDDTPVRSLSAAMLTPNPDRTGGGAENLAASAAFTGEWQQMRRQ